MKISYDPEHNIAYIRLHGKKNSVETIQISDELNIDIAPDGTVYGIELLNANEQMAANDQGNLVLEVDGQQREVPLTATERV